MYKNRGGWSALTHGAKLRLRVCNHPWPLEYRLLNVPKRPFCFIHNANIARFFASKEPNCKPLHETKYPKKNLKPPFGKGFRKIHA